jgi:GNAT superfamily N-acetyltransferase
LFGLNHAGEPPEELLAGRKKMQSGPNFREEQTIVVEGPAGDFVSFSGLCIELQNKIVCVESVATDPDFRRMGLGKAVVWEGIRRCGLLGATVAYVGSDTVFYQVLGFSKNYTSRCWMNRS